MSSRRQSTHDQCKMPRPRRSHHSRSPYTDDVSQSNIETSYDTREPTLYVRSKKVKYNDTTDFHGAFLRDNGSEAYRSQTPTEENYAGVPPAVQVGDGNLLKIENNSYSIPNQELQQMLEMMKTQSQKLQKMETRLDNQEIQWQGELDNMQKQVGKLYCDNQDLRERIENVEKDKKQLLKQISELEDAYRSAVSLADEKTKENDIFKAERADFEQELTKAKRCLEEKTLENSALKDDNRTLNEKNRDWEIRHLKDEQEISRLEKLLAKVKEEQSELSDLAKSLNCPSIDDKPDKKGKNKLQMWFEKFRAFLARIFGTSG